MRDNSGKNRPEGKPEFTDIEEELSKRLASETGRLLDLAGYREEARKSPKEWKEIQKPLMVRLNAERHIVHVPRDDRLGDRVVEIDELLGILARAVFERVHHSSSYSDIVEELRSAKQRPHYYTSHKSEFSVETETLIGRQLLLQKSNRNVAAVFELDAAPRDKSGRLRNLGSIGRAAAAALDELLAAHKESIDANESIAPELRPFLEKPISHTNNAFASSLRRWLTKVGKKPTRITEGKKTRSSEEEFLSIVLPPVNDIIKRFSGKTYSRDTLAREMSKRPTQLK